MAGDVLVALPAAALVAIRRKSDYRNATGDTRLAGAAMGSIKMGAGAAKPHAGQFAVNLAVNLCFRIDEYSGRLPVFEITARVGLSGEKTQVGEVGHIDVSLLPTPAYQYETSSFPVKCG